MLKSFRRKSIPISPAEKGLIYSPLGSSKAEIRDIEKAFARLFSSEDGQRVLSHLQVITFQRALNAEASNEQLRYMEGQRSMLATILRLIDRGRNPIVKF